MSNLTKPQWELWDGDALTTLKKLPSESVQVCVTSPPYYNLRDYGVNGQIGLEATPDAFIGRLVAVFAEVRRVLKDGGTLWVNIGDSYSSGGKAAGDKVFGNSDFNATRPSRGATKTPARPADTIPAKNLLMIPARLAIALQSNGWILRSEIVWAKKSPMPESVTDRPTRAHEMIYMLAKQGRYFYDAKAIAEPTVKRVGFEGSAKGYAPGDRNDVGRSDYGSREAGVRNKRTVWSLSSQPCKDAHFAVFPSEIPRLCIKASSRPGDTVLDCFSGAGTSGVVAIELGRNYIGIELNPEYNDIAERRITAQEDKNNVKP